MWFSYILTHSGQIALREGYEKVAEGAHCEVWMQLKAIKEYRAAPVNDRARASGILDLLSKRGPYDLNVKQFKQKGRYPSVSGSVMVFAVKSYQLRIYGGWLEGTPRVFICPEVAIKKTNKADKDQLKRVAAKVGEA